MIDGARLRHRIDIQDKQDVQDSETGLISVAWVNIATSVPAEISPLSVREFMAAQQMQSEIVARIVIRYRPGLTAKMRVIHNGRVYNPQGWLADNDSGIDYLTAPCSEGVNDG